MVTEGTKKQAHRQHPSRCCCLCWCALKKKGIFLLKSENNRAI